MMAKTTTNNLSCQIILLKAYQIWQIYEENWPLKLIYARSNVDSVNIEMIDPGAQDFNQINKWNEAMVPLPIKPEVCLSPANQSQFGYLTD